MAGVSGCEVIREMLGVSGGSNHGGLGGFLLQKNMFPRRHFILYYVGLSCITFYC